MQAFNQFIENLDLRLLFFMVGTMLWASTVYVAVLARQKCLDSTDPKWMKNSRFVGHLGFALTVLWVMTYADNTGWQPWPPMFCMMVAATWIMIMRAIALTHRTKAELLHRLSAMLGGKVVPGTNVVVPAEFGVTSVVAVSPGAEPHQQEASVMARQRVAVGVS